jgi:cytoskeletal protein CcmA (bactofilin family)
MGIWRKKSSPIQPTDTLIGSGTEFEGTLKTRAGLRIEGQFKGTIDCQGDIVIGKSGVVRSQVSARNVTIAGKLFGEVTARERLTILAPGELEGNIAAATLVIEDGAKFNGTSRMNRAEKDDAGRPQRTAKPERFEQTDRMGKAERTEPGAEAAQVKGRQAG